MISAGTSCTDVVDVGPMPVFEAYGIAHGESPSSRVRRT